MAFYFSNLILQTALQNTPFSSWGTTLHNQAAAEAILDRLVYHSHVIKIKGKSYRLAAQN